MQIAMGIILIVVSIFLIVVVLMQGGKSNNRLSGAIAGGAETFFGKSKASTMEKKLSRIVFAVLVLAMYLAQDLNYSVAPSSSDTAIETVADNSGDTSAAADVNGETAAP